MNDFLSVALKAVKKAGREIMKQYKNELIITNKKDNSPVTNVDISAEKIIIKTIKKSFPKHGFLGEELGSENNKSEYKWIIDPIDGTKNFIRKIPLFGTQLALMKDNEIILGVSYAPAIKELIYAAKGKGAYLNGKKISVSNIKLVNESYVSYGGLNLFNKHKLIPNLLSLISECKGRRGFGDFWSYHLLAMGKIDIFIEPETKIWDIAAVSLIVNEAGGKVTDIKCNKVNIKTTSIIATNGLLHKKIMNYF